MIEKYRWLHRSHTLMAGFIFLLLVCITWVLLSFKQDRHDIIVDSFSPNENIERPLEVHGHAASDWFTNGAFLVTIEDARGNVLGSVDAVALKDWRNTNEPVPFQAVFSYIPSNTKGGKVILHKFNTQGDRLDTYSIPVSFGSKKVLLFYPSTPASCGDDPFDGVIRYVSKDNKIKEAIELLIEGEIREDERQNGFYSYFPNSEFALKNVTQEGDILTLEFTPARAFTTGSPCYVKSLRSSIEQTAKQFYGVKEVRFVPENLFEL